MAPQDAAQRQTQFPPDSLTARTAVMLSICRLTLAGGAPDTVAAMQGVTLQPPQRFGDTPPGRARDGALGRVFDQDERVYAFVDFRPNDPAFTGLFLLIEQTGSKCLVSASGSGANMGAAMGLGLGPGWRRDGDTGLRGPNDERLRLTSAQNDSGATLTSFHFTKR